MKYILAGLIIIHGIIHLTGYLRAFGLYQSTEFSGEISKPAGLVWLMVSLLFIAAGLFSLTNIRFWPFLCITALIISQVLLFMNWKDAKFGSILNGIVLLIAVTAIAGFQWEKKVEAEIDEILSRPVSSPVVITDSQFRELPLPVQQWLRNTGIAGKKGVQCVRLKQKGELRTTVDGKWMPFTATQYFSVDDPSFIWQADVRFLPFLSLKGRDKLMSGKGEMVISLFSLIKLVNQGHNEKMNSGTMIRFLAEMIWFPSAALSDYISWEPIDARSAKATFRYNGQAVTGIFYFNEQGDLEQFTADRYYGGGPDSKKEKWIVDIVGYKEFNGIRIPHKNNVTWGLKEGDFNWAKMEITSLEYDVREKYTAQ